MNRSLVRWKVLLAGAVGLLALGACATAPRSVEGKADIEKEASHMEKMDMTAAEVMDRCQKMHAEKQKMVADMKAQDAELTAQLATMNSAPKDQKVDLLAAVVTSMVEKRIATDARMAKMQEKMMQHMMQHMQMGKESMAQCPMMKDMDAKQGDAKK